MDASVVSWAELSERLGEVTALLLTGDPPDEVLLQVVGLATRTIPAAASCSVTVPAADGPRTMTAANDMARQLDEMQYANGDGPCLDALREGSVISVPLMAEECRWGQYPQLAVRHGVLSSLSLPLAPAGKTLGALNMYATVPRGFDDEAMRALAELFAGQAGVTLGAAHRHGEHLELASGLRAQVDRLLAADRARAARAEQRRRSLEALIEVIAGSPDRQQVAAAAVGVAADSTAASAGVLVERVTGPAGDQLRLLAGRDVSAAGRVRLAGLPLEEAGPLAAALAELGDPVLVPAEEVGSHPLLADLVPGRAVAAVALPGRGQALGVLALTYPPGAEPDADGLGHLLTVARLGAAGLERAELAAAQIAATAAQARVAQRAALLAQASAALVGSVARNRALPTLLQAVVPDLADWAATHQLGDDGELRLVDVRHADPRCRDAVRAAVTLLRPATTDEAGIGVVAREGRIAHYPQVSPEMLAVFAADPAARRRLANLRTGAMLVVPLTAGDRVLATITLARRAATFTPEEVTLIGQITERAATSLHNSQLYQRERAAALTLQRSLLPADLPAAPGLRIAARYLAGTAGTEVGGDFYDVIPLSRGRTGLAIGDVMGRGITAAATMGQIRAGLRAYALEDHPPAALLTRLDRVVSALGTGLLTTCTYAVYDPATRELTVSTAGHIPPLLVGPPHPARPGQPASYLDLRPARPLGVHGPAFSDTVLHLAPATTLVLCTDGLIENRHQGLTEGLDRLATAVTAAATLPPDLLCDHILRALQTTPDAADDDTALLVASTPPAGQP